jgi:drug/metabolite transporter (DMT)-like permease|tara:strand:- start:6773 stop:7612 length:840 start_codon:yes stop_codon:yes gene_type:complete
MIALILTIILTTVLFLVFKEYAKRDINTHQAITFNYLTAALLALFIGGNNYNPIIIINTDWFLPTIALGGFFIFMFNIMALTTQKLGISIGSIASKMSLIIPVIGAIIFQNATLNFHKAIGIIVAIIAVYLTFKKSSANTKNLTLAIALFIGAGILDMWLDLIRNNYLSSNIDFNQFIFTVFFTAFSIGLIKIIWIRIKIIRRNVFAGIILGLPNYFSIYFVLLALENLGGVVVFPVLNIGVVLFSSIISWLFYKEKMSKTNWIGVTLACISILIIMWN